MNSLSTALAQHGYAILFATVFLESLGVPLPAALALLVAGAGAAQGMLRVPEALLGAAASSLAGDTLMYLIGRYTGWWLLGLLCRVSLNPESCILRSADAFLRRGRRLLVVAKFVPGLNTMAPPLAGSMQLPLRSFLQLDAAGVALYVGSYFAVGYCFSDALDSVTRAFAAFGRATGGAIGVLIILFLVVKLWFWRREKAGAPVAYVSALEAAEGLRGGVPIFDVRSHGYFDADAVRISGSVRLDPHTAHHDPAALGEHPRIYLYCTCVKEATSRRVARELGERFGGDPGRVAVIRGGLRAWKKAGLPIEGVPPHEVAALPRFT